MCRAALVVSAVLLIPAVGALDYVSGYELSFFVFYFVPVAMLAWCLGRAAGLGAATVCAVVWYTVDATSGRVYSHPDLGLWNAGLRWIAFALMAIALATIRATQRKEQELRQRLATTVAELQQSLAQIATLRNDVQIVCAWTNRIKSEGRWITFEDFMARHFQLRFSHGISEEGLRQLGEEANQDRDKPHGAGPTPSATD